MPGIQENITKRVLEQLHRDERIENSDIEAEFKDGTVILKGSAPNNRIRRLAEEHSLNVPEVVSVENRILLNTDVPSDSQVKESIEKNIKNNHDLDSENIIVWVKNGKVILEGSVNAYWKKFIADELVSLDDYVYDYSNKLAVIPNDTVKDELIAEFITTELDRNKYINVHDITVKVKEGTVTLSGKVDNWGAYQGVLDAAARAPGVIDIINNLIYKKS